MSMPAAYRLVLSRIGQHSRSEGYGRHINPGSTKPTAGTTDTPPAFTRRLQQFA